MNFIPKDIYELLIAILIGAVIGFEREYNGKAAGLRTMILICFGSTLFTILSVKIGGDAGRIAANILTGIGFIGGGIIFRENNRVVGLTTAATVWSTAALGMNIGSGHYELAIASAGLVILILYGFVPIEAFISKRNQVREYKITCKFQQKTLKNYEELFKELGLRAKRGQQSRQGEIITGNWTLLGSEKRHEHLIKRILNDPQVITFEF